MRKRIVSTLTVLVFLLSVWAGACAETAGGSGVQYSFFFGHYPQTASGTDQAPIEWIVLEEKNDKMLLISKYGLDAVPFHTEETSVTWENCSLRSWLNSEFLQAAFTEDEQAYICSSKVRNGHDENYDWWLGGYDGEDTEDRIFLLSYAEVTRYFGMGEDNIPSRMAPTEYARTKSRMVSNRFFTEDGEKAGDWLLRSPGFSFDQVCTVEWDGSLGEAGVNSTSPFIRPAFWLDLNPGKDRSQEERDEKIAMLTATGSIIKYGHYEQNDKTEDGSEEIEWLVLEAQGTKVLLISRYVLDVKPFNEQINDGAVWEDSWIRKWLNDEFFSTAFSAEQQGAVQWTEVDNSKSQQNVFCHTDGSANTQDRVFFLSYAETEKHSMTIWIDSYYTQCGGIPTYYAMQHGIGKVESCHFQHNATIIYPCCWWLRTPGKYRGFADIMGYYGILNEAYVDTADCGVRPVIWLDLEAAGLL